VLDFAHTLTADGIRLAIFYTKVHGRLLRPVDLTPPLVAAMVASTHRTGRWKIVVNDDEARAVRLIERFETVG
jgi:hypothetical protein